jgi:CheY-like chemotaxis protein
LADEVQMHQILMNLCTNAAHAMKKGGILGIGLTDTVPDADFLKEYPDANPGPHVRLTVSDTGQGMPPEIIARIFEPYFTTKPKNEGTGLGLAVVRGIVKSYNGVIAVQSEPGKGSTFSVFLPAMTRDAHVPEESDMPLPRGNERILFVDDEPVIAELGVNMLETLGYTVTAKTSSTEALGSFRADPDRFDLVITDMTMPNMTGDQLARSIWDIRPGVPVILCTGYNEMMSEDKALAMGICKFILKPIEKDELALAIRSALNCSPPPYLIPRREPFLSAPPA